MKLDKIKFSFICVIIQGWFDDHKSLLSEYDIGELDRMIDIEIPVAAYANASDVNYLMELMAGGQKKIEAIKTYRTLTGLGLKESKDQVEKYWPALSKHYVPAVTTESSTLGDILANAECGGK